MDAFKFIGRNFFIARARAYIVGCWTKPAASSLILILLAGSLSLPSWADDAAIQLSTNNGNTQFGFQNSNGADLVTVNSVGTVQISSTAVLSGTTFYSSGLAEIGSGTPSIIAPATQECTGGTPTLGAGSSNYAGTITCSTSGGAGTIGIIATVAPSFPAPHAWICTVRTANVATSTAVGSTDMYVVSSTGTWVLLNTSAMTTALTFSWNYVCGAM